MTSMRWPRRLLTSLAAPLLLTGCSAMVFLGAMDNIVDDGGEEGLNHTHVFSKSVSILDADGEPTGRVNEVVRGERYRVSIALAWQNDGGVGEVRRTWRFVRDGDIYGIDHGEVDVDRSPFLFEVDADSAHKPAGRYGYQLYIDDRLITRVDVVIVDEPTPSPTPHQPNRGW